VIALGFSDKVLAICPLLFFLGVMKDHRHVMSIWPLFLSVFPFLSLSAAAAQRYGNPPLQSESPFFFFSRELFPLIGRQLLGPSLLPASYIFPPLGLLFPCVLAYFL